MYDKYGWQRLATEARSPRFRSPLIRPWHKGIPLYSTFALLLPHIWSHFGDTFLPLHSVQIHGFRPISSQHGLRACMRILRFQCVNEFQKKMAENDKKALSEVQLPWVLVLCHRNCPDNHNQLNKLTPSCGQNNPICHQTVLCEIRTVSPIKNWSVDDS